MKFASVTPNVTTFTSYAQLAYVWEDWVEHYWIGQASNGKYGIWVDGGAATNPKFWTNCSIHDSKVVGFFCNSTTTSLGITYSNNVLWYIQGDILTISGTITNTDWTMDNNLIVRAIGNTTAANIRDVGGTFTNNIMAGCNNWAIVYGETGATIGTFTGNVIHSCGGGLEIVAPNMTGTLNFESWRNQNVGYYLTSSANNTTELILDSVKIFGNVTANFDFNASTYFVLTGTNIVGSETAYTTTSNFFIHESLAGVTHVNIVNVDNSGLIGPTNDFLINQTPVALLGTMNNYKSGATNFFNSRTNLSRYTSVGLSKKGGVTGAHENQMKYGVVSYDATVFATAAPSARMTPNSASFKLESASINLGELVAVNSGDTVTAAVNINKNASYNGAQPRLIVRKNVAIGITADTVLATYSASTGSFNIISGTTAAATDDGVMEFIVDCDGTAGFINVDDWAFT